MLSPHKLLSIAVRIDPRPLLLLLVLIAGGCIEDRPIYYKIAAKYPVSDPQFSQTVGSLLGPPLIAGNSVRTLSNGKEIFPAMLDAIHSARKSITLETYIYWGGKIGKEFTDALSERARAGVKTHVLIDWIGSGQIDRDYINQMQQAGADVHEYHACQWYDPSTWRNFDHRTHRKILVVDGKIGFTGGVGIADDWLGNADSPNHWRDSHYRIEGPVVGQLQAAFCDNWMQTTGRVLEGDDYFPGIPSAGNQVCQMFRSSSSGGSENMELLFLLSIAKAGQFIRMESAYFDPDYLTRRRLMEAHHRGVSIKIIVPGARIDEKIVRAASRSHWGELLKSDIEIYEYQPTMIHCKLMIVDDLWVSIGSANLDNRSFRLNDEANHLRPVGPSLPGRKDRQYPFLMVRLGNIIPGPMIYSLTPQRLAASVLAVPPLCRNADFSLNETENAKLVRHLEAGGIRTLLYGGNANFYHIALSEYDQALSLIATIAGADTLVIPSAGPAFGMMMDQAKVLRRHRFPTVMILPQQGITTSDGVEIGIRRFTDAAGIPALLYIKQDGFIDVKNVAALARDNIISAIKYATVRTDPAKDEYLNQLVQQVDRKLIISGIGEQPAIVHMRQFGLAGFTSGCVCIAPALSAAMLEAIKRNDWQKAEQIRQTFKPLEDIRNAINPIRVLHEAVRLAGIADTGALLPLLTNLPEHAMQRIEVAATALSQAGWVA
jgi:cardiolipin synthase